jgi:glutamate-1-semialdehyde aminotransferase
MQVLKRSLRESQALLERARRLIPSATQTFSKGPTQFVQGVTPAFLRRGRGSHVWDVDENEYIDYVTGLGPVILGYADPDVDAAVARQLEDGVTFSLPHPLEVEVAEMLTEIIPGAEMVRYGKNGSDATSGAVRAARAYTGRDLIACCGYHGWQDWYIGTTTRRAGVPEAVQRLTRTFAYNDIESLERLFVEHPGEIAAVVMEPVGVVPPREGFLQEVAELTRRGGALLVFDEIVTGFRLALGGGQEYFGVTPDLSAFGKAMANGFPIAAVVGRRDVMGIFDEIFFSFTFGGEAVSLAAAKATMAKMRREPVIAHLWRQGTALQDGYNRLAAEFGLAERTRCIGMPPRTVLRFTTAAGSDSLEMRSLVQQELAKRGVLILTGFNLCYAHSDEDVERTLGACREALDILANVDERNISSLLEGPPVQAVFRRA